MVAQIWGTCLAARAGIIVSAQPCISGSSDRSGIRDQYADILTAPALAALAALAPFNRDRLAIMAARIERRRARARNRRRIEFLDPDSLIPRTNVRVADARAGNFDGGEIPTDLERQWIQGTDRRRDRARDGTRLTGNVDFGARGATEDVGDLP